MDKNKINSVKELKKMLDNLRLASAVQLHEDLTSGMTYLMAYVDAPPQSADQMAQDFARMELETKLQTYLMQANAKLKLYNEKTSTYRSVSHELEYLLKLGDDNETQVAKTVS